MFRCFLGWFRCLGFGLVQLVCCTGLLYWFVVLVCCTGLLYWFVVLVGSTGSFSSCSIGCLILDRLDFFLNPFSNHFRSYFWFVLLLRRFRFIGFLFAFLFPFLFASMFLSCFFLVSRLRQPTVVHGTCTIVVVSQIARLVVLSRLARERHQVYFLRKWLMSARGASRQSTPKPCSHGNGTGGTQGHRHSRAGSVTREQRDASNVTGHLDMHAYEIRPWSA